MDNNIRILIGGDIYPTESNRFAFETGDIESVIEGKLLSRLQESDIRIFNLETPVCDKETPIEKEGPCFKTSCKSMNGLKKLNPSVFTLANNHILDQGEEGLYSTLKVLSEYGIPYVGVGENIRESDKPYFIDIKGRKIGVYACVEHEYTCATEMLAGANPFDSLEIADRIRKIRTECDFLVVLYHGGKEYYEYPSPDLQKRCRKMADCGADVIICQHSHCIGTSEEYNNCKIIYGQGNFLMDRYIKAYEKFFQTGMLVEIMISKDSVNYQYVPIIKQGFGIRLANQQEKDEILLQFNERSANLLDEKFVVENYQRYVKKVASRYIVRLSRCGYIFSSLDNRFLGGKIFNKDLKKILGKHQRLAIQNCLQCEVHNEILRTYLDNR
ncbi:MAG: CapA family protein [Lachnospiraceae bacterium]|nr:CapA family protein [Lachnospiraceae bacterium]